MYTVVKKKVSFTGVVSMGWHLGFGYVQQNHTAKAEKWCVVSDVSEKPIAVCTSRKSAVTIAFALNRMGNDD